VQSPREEKKKEGREKEGCCRAPLPGKCRPLPYSPRGRTDRGKKKEKKEKEKGGEKEITALHCSYAPFSKKKGVPI